MLSSFSIRGSISGSSTGRTRRRLPVAATLAKRLGLNSVTIEQISYFYRESIKRVKGGVGFTSEMLFNDRKIQ